jgi:hypothetical protein
MILVQNRLLQLNGNKNLKSKFYIFCFLLLGCSAFVKAGTPSDSTYKIAMILPFHMYDYNGANVNRSNIMLDYYQGFYLALKEYEAKGLNVKVYVYDNEHDTNKTKEILEKPELKQMDLIISPIMNEHLHLLNHFSSKNQIAVMSPFTAIDSLFPNNPLFFNAAPAEKTKAEIFYDYYRKAAPDKILLILKNEEEWNNAFGPQLQALLESKDKVDYRIASTSDLAKADSNFLPKWKHYLVFHNAETTKDIKVINNFFDKQKSTFEVVADYKPSTLKYVPKVKRNKYNYKILSADYTNPEDSSIILKDFKTTYKNTFNLNISRYSVIGHDQAAFISEMLLKYDRFRANDFVGEPHQYYATRFVFKKDMHCNQNKAVFILKISEEDILEEVKY